MPPEWLCGASVNRRRNRRRNRRLFFGPHGWPMVFFSGECLGRGQIWDLWYYLWYSVADHSSKILMNKNLNQNIRCIFEKKQEGQHSCKMIVRYIIWIDLAMQLFPKLRWSILSRSGEDGLDFVPELLIQRWVCQGSAGQPRGQGEQTDWSLIVWFLFLWTS